MYDKSVNTIKSFRLYGTDTLLLRESLSEGNIKYTYIKVYKGYYSRTQLQLYHTQNSMLNIFQRKNGTCNMNK